MTVYTPPAYTSIFKTVLGIFYRVLGYDIMFILCWFMKLDNFHPQNGFQLYCMYSHISGLVYLQFVVILF